MSTENQLAIPAQPRASDQLASFLGIEKSMMLDTLKAQCFKGKRPDEVSDAQLAAFVSTANALQVNPLLPGFLYAYPERNGGITPILGPDGVFKKLDEMISTGKLKGYKCEVKMGADGKPESATAIIQRAADQIPAEYTAYFSEWCVTSNPNWVARPRHMIWTRAIKQAARQVIHGLPMDADEYEIANMANVTPEVEQPVVQPRPEPKPRAQKGAAAVQENPAPRSTEVAGEIVPETTTVAEPAPAPATETVATPPPEQPVQSFADAAKATEAEPAPGPRAFLQDGETFSTTVKVVELKANVMKSGEVSIPTVKAKLTGGFVGDVYHKEGAKAVAVGAATTYEPLPPWKVGAELNVTLLGQKNKSGAVLAYVQGVEEVMGEF
jgi:hypothetical protein